VPDAPADGRRGAAIALAATIAVGSIAFTLIKVVLREITPLWLATGRVLFSAAAFGLVVLLQPHRRRPIAARDRFAVLACGLGGSVGFHLLFSWGQQHVTVAVSSVVLGCMPVLVAAAEVTFLSHRLRLPQVAGLALSLAGITAVSWGSGAGAVSALGVAAIAGATLVWAGVTVVTRSLADRYDPWWLNTPGTLAGAGVMLALVAVHPSGFGLVTRLSAAGWLSVVWLGAVSSAFIYAAQARAMQDLSATAVASVGTLLTPVSLLVAWVWLGERPGLPAFAGAACVIGGVLLVTLRSGPPASPTRRDRPGTRSRTHSPGAAAR
jgi:drug/metabolite transporter (DMT)-like permease